MIKDQNKRIIIRKKNDITKSKNLSILEKPVEPKVNTMVKLNSGNQTAGHNAATK